MHNRITDKAEGRKAGQNNGHARMDARAAAFGVYARDFWKAFKNWRNVSTAPMVMSAAAAHPSEFYGLAMRLASEVGQASPGVSGVIGKGTAARRRRSTASATEFGPVVEAFVSLCDQGAAAVAVAVMREYTRNPGPFVTLAWAYAEQVPVCSLPPMAPAAMHVEDRPRYRVSLTLPSGEARELRDAAAAEGVTVSELARRMIHSYAWDNEAKAAAAKAAAAKAAAAKAAAAKAAAADRVPDADLAELFNYEGGEIVTESAPIRSGKVEQAQT